jgi:hypothetical protein
MLSTVETFWRGNHFTGVIGNHFTGVTVIKGLPLGNHFTGCFKIPLGNYFTGLLKVTIPIYTEPASPLPSLPGQPEISYPENTHPP